MNNSSPMLETLVAHYQEFLGFLEKRVGRATAEDILQEAFARGIAKEDDLKREAAALAWFYRTLRNAVIDHYRRTGASERALEAFAHELDSAVSPEVEVRTNPCACVGHLAKTLKPEYEHVLTRIEVEGATVGEYAVEEGLKPNSAAVRAFRARKALERRVVRECGACAAAGCTDCTCSR